MQGSGSHWGPIEECPHLKADGVPARPKKMDDKHYMDGPKGDGVRKKRLQKRSPVCCWGSKKKVGEGTSE